METCPWMEALVAVGRKTFSQVLGGGGTLWAQLEAFTTMFLRHQAVHVTFLTLEKRKPSSIWMTFYSTYMGYSTTSTNGRGHSAFKPQDQSNTEAESTTDTTLPSSLNYDEQSMSDVGTTVSDYDSPGNSVNEEEGGMRERRDSGVGASLTRPSRWVKPFYRVYRKSWPVHTALSAVSTYLDKEFLVLWNNVIESDRYSICLLVNCLEMVTAVPWKPTCSSSVFGI